jgi:hypothetical protein
MANWSQRVTPQTHPLARQTILQSCCKFAHPQHDCNHWGVNGDGGETGDFIGTGAASALNLPQ